MKKHCLNDMCITVSGFRVTLRFFISILIKLRYHPSTFTELNFQEVPASVDIHLYYLMFSDKEFLSHDYINHRDTH